MEIRARGNEKDILPRTRSSIDEEHRIFAATVSLEIRENEEEEPMDSRTKFIARPRRGSRER